MVPKNVPLLNILKNHGKSKYDFFPQSSWNYHCAVFKIPLWNSMQTPGWFRMWFFLLDHPKIPNKLRSHCSPNESTNQALALRKILVVHRIPIGPSPGPVRTTGMGNGGLRPRKMVTCHGWSIGIRSRGSHTLHTSHNHWKGKSMEKWWIWRYDLILIIFYPIIVWVSKKIAISMKTKVANQWIMAMILQKKGHGDIIRNQFWSFFWGFTGRTMSHPLEKTKSLRNKKFLYLFALSCRSLKSSFESNAPSAVSHHPHSEDIVAVQPQPCERVRINDSLTLFTLVEARYPKTMNLSGQAPWTQIREANSPPVGKIGRYKWKTHGFPIHDCLCLWRINRSTNAGQWFWVLPIWKFPMGGTSTWMVYNGKSIYKWMI